jgi:hypothetical protein
MGGRGHHDDVEGYLNSGKRTCEYNQLGRSEDGAIDFIQDAIQPGAPLTPEFSNSPNKIYALIGKDGEIKSITYYDANHEQTKTIHMDHEHKGKRPHAHSGMNTGRKDVSLTSSDMELIAKVNKIWKGRK